MNMHRYVTDRDAIATTLGESFASIEAGVLGIVVSIESDEPKNPVAAVLDIDPLTQRGGQRALDEALFGELKTKCVVAWSGSLGDMAFARDIGTWGPAGQQAFEAMVDRLRGVLMNHGKRLLLRPHCRHVLSDAQRMMRFMLEEERCAGRSPFGLALDPTSLLEPTMLGVAGDHIERAMEALGSRADLVFLTGVAFAQAEASDAASTDELLPQATPVHDGVIDAAKLGAVVASHVPAATPVVLLDMSLDEQLEALGLVRASPSGP